MSDRVGELEVSGRLENAAREAERAGRLDRASELFERACLFDDAARCALKGGDLRRAALTAALGRDEGLLQRACEKLASAPEVARGVASTLAGRGDHRAAAMALAAAGDVRAAAQAWAAARDPLRSARAWQQADDVREAARVLEAAMRDDPDRQDVLAALGTLLASLGKHEAAARVLQRVAPGTPERASVLPHLAACFEALGLSGPREAVEREAAQAGVSLAASAQPLEAAPRGVIYGRYEVVRVAASTPSARVLEAIDRVSGAKVAVKQLLASGMIGAGRDAFLRLVREARALHQLRHPHVVPLVELLEDAAAIVTPWMGGGSLKDQIARGPVSPARAVEIACVVLGALAEAHRLGILHRDLKPSNVLFDDAGVPLLADFGAAHVSDSSATATAAVIGTFSYMSPEQRAGLPASAASDVFGVGATLLELLTGRTPPLQGPIAWLPSLANPDLGPAHDRILQAMLAEAPSERPASALDARNLLRSESWPGELPRAPLQTADHSSHDTLGSSRLREIAPGLWRDDWLGRDVMLVPSDDDSLRLARAWTEAECDALAVVLRADSAENTLWVERPCGAPGTNLSVEEVARLRAAIARLHARGVAHGAVDADHVVRTDDGVVLLFDAEAGRRATAAGDEAALRELESRAM